MGEGYDELTWDGRRLKYHEVGGVLKSMNRTRSCLKHFHYSDMVNESNSQMLRREGRV